MADTDYKKDLRILVNRLLPSYLLEKTDENYLAEFVKLWLQFIDIHYYTEFQNMKNALDIDKMNDVVDTSESITTKEEVFYDGYSIVIGDKLYGQVLYDGSYIDKPSGAIGTITDYYEFEKDTGSIVNVIDVSLDYGNFFEIDRVVVKDSDGINLDYEAGVLYTYDEKREFYSNLFINQYGYNFKKILSDEIATTESKQLMVKNIKNINEKKGNELSFIRFFNSFRPKFFDDNINVRMISNLYYLDGELIEFSNHEEVDNYVLGLSVPDDTDDYYEAGVRNDYLNMIPATFIYKLETNLDPEVFREVLEESIHPAGFKFIYEYISAWSIAYITMNSNYAISHHVDSTTSNTDLGLTDHYGVLV